MMESLANIDSLSYEEELNMQECLVIPGNVRVITKGAIHGSGTLKEIVFENGVQEIQTGAITSCPNLERVVIPKSISSIGDDNLDNCKSVREVVAPAETDSSPYWGSNGVLYRRLPGTRSELFYYPPGKPDPIYRFPENVRCGFAGKGSPFKEAEALTALQIPSRWLEGSITNLKQMFDRKSQIKELYIQSDVFPEIISSDAFTLCQSLRLTLIYQIGNERIIIDPLQLDSDVLDASSNGKEIPFARIIAAQSLTDGNTKVFIDWAGKALKKKKEAAILVRLIKFHGADKDSLNLIAEQFLSRTSKKGIKSAEAENYVDFCLQCVEQLESRHLSNFYDQCVAKGFDGIVQRLDNDPRAKLVLSGEGEDARNEIEAYVIERYRETDEIKWLSGYDLSGVKYKDTRNEVPEFVVRYVLASYTSQLDKMPRHIGGYKRDAVELSIDGNADKVADCFENTSFMALLNKLSAFRNTNQPDLKTLKLIVAAGRYESEEWIRDLSSRCSWWSEWYTYGVSGRAAVIVAHGAIMLNDTKAAISFTDNKLGSLYRYAAMRGTSVEVIRNKVLADVGLDESGSKCFSYGNTNVRVSLNGDMKYDIYNVTKGKTTKSLPKDSSDEVAWSKASDEFKKLKRDTREVIKNQTNTAFTEFLSGKKHKTEEWKSAYLENPLLIRFAELLVWKYDNKGFQTYFTLNDGKIIDVIEHELELDGGNVCVAHPIEMDKGELLGWQKYFLKMNRKQPFEQIWEPVIDMGKFKTDRYAGRMIPYHKFLHREKDGIKVSDYDFHNKIMISFADCNAVVKRIDWARHEIDMNHRFEVEFMSILKATRTSNHILAYLDRITVIDRVMADDVSISEILDNFSFAQVEGYIKLANKNNCNNVLAMLMNYKNANFPDYDPMDEFVLD